jgi:bla regulator protein BlaR1
MPQSLINSLHEEQLRHIFLHELAHCKRNDIAINGLMQILLIFHWFNPVLWYAYQRMREDQEIASDALALTYLDPTKRQDYGYTLIQLLENYANPIKVPGNVNLSGSKSQLQRRIIMIKQFHSNSYRWSFIGLAALLIISSCSLTNATVNPKPGQSSNAAAVDSKLEQSSNSPVIEQENTVTADTNSLTTGTATMSESTATAEPKPTTTDRPAASVSELQPQPAAEAPAPQEVPRAAVSAPAAGQVALSAEEKRAADAAGRLPAPTLVPTPVPQ